jgi:Protein of unknown function (DUF4031)
MSVYVDGGSYAFGRMKMCHMVADTTAELLEMADRIGVTRRWLQKPGTAQEHFDVCKSKRALAVAAGAKEVGRSEFVAVIRGKRGPLPEPTEDR